MLLVLAHGVLLVLDSWEDFVFHMTVLVFKARDGAFSDTLFSLRVCD